MITIDFNNRGTHGLCEFLYLSLKNQILDGTLKADEKLPSKRSLAEHLGISVITVQNAYSQLISEGYLYSIEKKGFFVTDISIESPFLKNRADSPAESRTRITPSPQNEASPNARTYFTDFTSNATSVEKFPFSLWAHLMRKVLNSSDEKLLQRISVHGAFELRCAVAEYLLEFRNMDVRPEQIVIGSGTENLYAMIVQLLGREKLYAVENPGYRKVANVFKINGAECIPVEIDGQGINPALLEKVKADVVHVSPSHHFPTGIVMPVRRRLELLEWAQKKNGRFIIEDDYDSEFRFNGKPLQTLQSYDKNGRVIYINTFSKTLSPSFRISYMVLPLELTDAFNRTLGFYSCSVSAFEQYTLSAFIRGGFYGKHLIRMKNYYRTLRNDLIGALQKSRLSHISHITEQEAGLHFLLSVQSLKTKTELNGLLENAGIKIAMLSDFYYEGKTEQKDGEHTFVVNYSGIKKERISETIARLEAVFLT